MKQTIGQLIGKATAEKPLAVKFLFGGAVDTFSNIERTRPRARSCYCERPNGTYGVFMAECEVETLNQQKP